ncbi:SDR family NAD(P)-dependent oxidoreductase [Aspergillus foveolatus]|uniref:SDR family NAD(P)-dependent oxidoreductase n=1 Tax=Aspergillus foveolatus TaxID=210207 RepID=UPI003CCD22AD
MSSSSLKVALVTASSAGLGAAIAKVLAANMRVIINYSSNAQRAELVQEEMTNIAGGNSVINDQGEKQPRFAAICADLANRVDIKRLVAEAVSMMGRLDVVVSNGGWTRIRKFDDLDQNVDEEDWDRCYEINVKSHLYLLHEAQVYLDAAQGSFVTVASVAGVKPSGSSIPYSVTKAAQIHMVKCLAHAVGPNIRVNSVSPGILLTDWGRQFPEDHLQAAKDGTLLKRFATVEDVAQAVKLLALNSSLTGHNLIIDSGFSI